MNSATEFDDKPGPVRDALVRSQSLWRGTLRRAFEIAKEGGQLKPEAAPAQLAFEMHSLMLGSYLYYRLLEDPDTVGFVRRGFDRLIASAAAQPE